MKHALLFTLSFLTSFYTQAMNEREFVERLQNIHPFFEQLELSTQIKKIEKQATTAAEDWIIGVDVKHKNEDARHISSIATYNDLTTTSLDVSATKKYSILVVILLLNTLGKKKIKTLTLLVISFPWITPILCY